MNKLIYLVLVISLFFYCAPKQEKVEKYMEDGVEVVLNHLEPYKIKGEPSTLILEEEFTIDTERDEMIQIGLTDLIAFDVDSKGSIFLFNAKNKENRRKTIKAWEEKNKEKLKKYFQNYYLENKEEIRRKTSEYVKKNRNKRNISLRITHKKRRLEALKKINDPPRCNCCHIDNFHVLCIDHIHNDGAEERKKLSPHLLYNKIIRI